MSEPERLSPPPFSVLYPILDDEFESEDELEEDVAALGRAGCRLFQLRAKELGAGAFHRWARIAKAAARRAGIGLVINDRVDVALLVGADGVHLGQDDVAPETARRLLGERAVIGLSTHDVGQARAAGAAPVDYVAIGPVFESTTKKGAHPAIGVEGVREARSVVEKPLVAIGGITLERARGVLDAGADGLAVISALKRGTLESVAREWMELRARS